ncbi:MAG: hypothetical protein GYB52_06795 [Rhodospirillales bacterium]|nr:hypothetical protein [Rhodospirillales bacterium]MBR9816321.1 hypothetical protein [Rhodospirillales bacterium]
MTLDPKTTSDAAFTWAAFGAAESFLHALSRNSKGATSCAGYILDFIAVGGLALPPHHFIDKTTALYPWLEPYRHKANRMIEHLQAERGQTCAK